MQAVAYEEPIDFEEIIAQSPMFCDCGLDASAFMPRSYRRGQIVSDRPEGHASAGLIAVGAIDVYSIALDGSEIKLNALGAGEAFGICNLFAKSDLDTVLKCRKDATVLFITKERLIEALVGRPEAMVRYARLCNEKIQFLISRIELLTMQSCRAKLLEYLITRADASGRLALTSSKEQLAKELGVGRASLFRELSQLQGEGLIATEGATIVVLDRKALEARLYAQC